MTITSHLLSVEPLFSKLSNRQRCNPRALSKGARSVIGGRQSTMVQLDPLGRFWCTCCPSWWLSFGSQHPDVGHTYIRNILNDFRTISKETTLIFMA